MRGRRACQLLALLVLLATGGCSSIPPGGDPALDLEDLQLRLRAPLGRLAVAPIGTLALATDEATKEWRALEVFEPAALVADIVSGVSAAGSFLRVRRTEGGSLAETWQARDDFVLAVDIENIRTRLVDTTFLRVPNMLIWFLFMVPSWWIATERYALSFDATTTVHEASTGAIVDRWTVPIAVEGTFDEWDRGWQFWGFVNVDFDSAVWRQIASKLLPAAQRSLAATVARRLDSSLRSAVASPAFAEATRKTLVLSVGVGHYADPVHFPALPNAPGDARAVVETLADRTCDVHTVTLVDGDATTAAVTSAIEGHLSRARDGDRVTFYFAGYGTRAADGSPRLLCHDARAGDDGLALDALASALSLVEGDKLILIDAAFDGRGRSVRGGTHAGKSDAAIFEQWRNTSALLAAGPGDGAIAPEHLGHGLFTFHLLEAIGRAADMNRDGVTSVREMSAYIEPRVAAEAEILGERQTPTAAGVGRAFALPVTRSR
jgi:hypothetical protein